MGASDSIYTGKSTFMVELLVRCVKFARCCQVLSSGWLVIRLSSVSLGSFRDHEAGHGQVTGDPRRAR